MNTPRLREEHLRFVRYLLAGGWNTFFGMLSYAVLYRLLGHRIHYIILLIPANILSVTNAFLCYRYFVFRSRGNFLREYFRCYVVYGGMIFVNAALMYILVDWLNLTPILANCACIAVTTVVSFFAHRNFSFRPPV